MTTWNSSHHTQATGPMVVVVLVIGGAVAAFWTLFMAGEMLTDPGGWYGVGLVSLWLVPMVALSALALLRSSWAAPVLTVLVGLWVAAAAVTVVYADAWREIEDTHGPISLLVMVALCVPLVALGRDRSLLAGVLLLVVAATNVVTGLLWVVTGAGLGGTLALAIVGLPFVVLGVVLIVVGVLDRRAEGVRGSLEGPGG